jgi:hypothetical protein
VGQTVWLSAGIAIITGSLQVSDAQQAQTLNGPPIQLQPYVDEPGVPAVTINPGTPNPFGGLDGGTGGNRGTGSDGSGSGNVGSSDALNTMIGTSWGAQAAANAQALGLNPSALAATCVLESGCGASAGNGSGAQGVFQMFPGAFQEGLQTALTANPGLAPQIMQDSAGMNDPVTEAIAASGYLIQANQALQNAGIANPTVLDARAYYNFGPTNGLQLAQADPSETMAQAMPNVSQAALTANGIAPSETVAQWRASVAAKIGDASNQNILS